MVQFYSTYQCTQRKIQCFERKKMKRSSRQHYSYLKLQCPSQVPEPTQIFRPPRKSENARVEVVVLLNARYQKFSVHNFMYEKKSTVRSDCGIGEAAYERYSWNGCGVLAVTWRRKLMWRFWNGGADISGGSSRSHLGHVVG